MGDLLKGKKREMGQSEAGRLVRKSRTVLVEKVLAEEKERTIDCHLATSLTYRREANSLNVRAKLSKQCDYIKQ